MVLRTPIILAAVAVAGALTLSACGPVKLGSAALVSNQRISAATLAAEVSNLNAAYQANKGKVQLQFPAAQMPQQVLSWLVRFQVRDRLAERQGITVTREQTQAALASVAAQAQQAGVTTQELAVANGIPPDQLTELGRYVAIEEAVLTQMDGGTLPTSTAAQTALGNQFNAAQCRAAKSLDIQINPQFGELDFSQLGVVPAPPKLAAGIPVPSSTATAAPQLTPHC